MRQVDIPLDKLLVSVLNARKDLSAGQEDSGIEELAWRAISERYCRPHKASPAAFRTVRFMAPSLPAAA